MLIRARLTRLTESSDGPVQAIGGLGSSKQLGYSIRISTNREGCAVAMEKSSATCRLAIPALLSRSPRYAQMANREWTCYEHQRGHSTNARRSRAVAGRRVAHKSSVNFMTSLEDRNNLRMALALLQLFDIDQGREIKPPYYRLTIDEARQLVGINHKTPGPEARWRDASQELTGQELDALSLEQLKIRRQQLLRLMESLK
jgi:hypothetical protein